MDMDLDVNPFPGRTGFRVQATGPGEESEKQRVSDEEAGWAMGAQPGSFSAAACMDSLTPARASAIDLATPF